MSKSSVHCQVSIVYCLISILKDCPLSKVQCPLSKVQCLVSSVQCQSDCPLSKAHRLLSNVYSLAMVDLRAITGLTVWRWAQWVVWCLATWRVTLLILCSITATQPGVSGEVTKCKNLNIFTAGYHEGELFSNRILQKYGLWTKQEISYL